MVSFFFKTHYMILILKRDNYGKALHVFDGSQHEQIRNWFIWHNIGKVGRVYFIKLIVEPNVDLPGFAATSKTKSVCPLIHNVILSMNREEMYGKVICHYGILCVLL